MPTLDPQLQLLPVDLRHKLQEQLARDEKIVWAGQPNAQNFGRGTRPLLLIGLAEIVGAALCAAIAVRLFSALDSRVGFMVLLFFACLQLFIAFIVLRFALTVRNRSRRTVYAITNQRALSIEPPLLGKERIRSYTRRDLDRMVVRERAGGGGDIVFQEPTTDDPERVIPAGAFGFLAVDHVREVERILRENI